jgi:hypothetical protein
VAQKAVALALALALVILPASLPAETPPPADPDVARGMAQIDEGDYDAAILTLDNAARRLAQDSKRTRELSQAYLYLGIAYMGKGHEAAAKAKFREALAQIKDLTLSPEKFPPKVIDVFEAAKEEEAKASAAAPAAVSATGTHAAAPEKKKGGSGKILLIVGGVAAAGGIAAAAAGGGSKAAAPTTTTQPRDPRTVQNVGPITLIATDAGYLNETTVVVAGTGVLDATVTWTFTGGDKPAIIDMELLDNAFNRVAVSNRTSDTTSVLQANVSPLPGAPSQEYHLDTHLRENCGTCQAVFNLTIKHP